MEVQIVDDYEAMSLEGTEIAAETVERNPGTVLGLATGNTYLRFYEELVRRHEEQNLSFSGVVTFNLDEYVGIDSNHPESFRRYMHENFLKHIDIQEENVHIPDGKASDLKLECQEFEEEIEKSGGIDLQFLGIGANGHIAYNEPGSSFDSRTRVIELSDETMKRKRKSLKSGREVPKRAITMGMGTIMDAEKIVLMASGKKKAEAVARALEGPVTEKLPASALQKHPDCKFILDEDSASELSRPK